MTLLADTDMCALSIRQQLSGHLDQLEWDAVLPCHECHIRSDGKQADSEDPYEGAAVEGGKELLTAMTVVLSNIVNGLNLMHTIV